MKTIISALILTNLFITFSARAEKLADLSPTELRTFYDSGAFQVLDKKDGGSVAATVAGKDLKDLNRWLDDRGSLNDRSDFQNSDKYTINGAVAKTGIMWDLFGRDKNNEDKEMELDGADLHVESVRRSEETGQIVGFKLATNGTPAMAKNTKVLAVDFLQFDSASGMYKGKAVMQYRPAPQAQGYKTITGRVLVDVESYNLPFRGAFKTINFVAVADEDAASHFPVQKRIVDSKGNVKVLINIGVKRLYTAIETRQALEQMRAHFRVVEPLIRAERVAEEKAIEAARTGMSYEEYKRAVDVARVLRGHFESHDSSFRDALDSKNNKGVLIIKSPDSEVEYEKFGVGAIPSFTPLSGKIMEQINQLFNWSLEMIIDWRKNSESRIAALKLLQSTKTASLR